ncbi:alkaline protease [Myriangium duriaei CBS 260.36]|uniref:Alkaline protease n=1 Tax=Myriangium duriaei CBS 260.36 TaxID=1168546 RepID=A0A9P4MIN0_9PEZI|nr:alkaline protease [Myriangium duriaei CBS 260.36]
MIKHLSFIQDLCGSDKILTHSSFRGVTRNYSIGNFQGYAGHFDKSTIEQLQKHKDVNLIETDKIAEPRDVHIERRDIIGTREAEWGLRQISHRRAEDTGYYYYDTTAGRGTYGYVVDTGIDTKHGQFIGRASMGYNALGSCCKPKPFTDTDGQGTLVAGIIGGQRYGVARNCNLIAVKVAKDLNVVTSKLLDGYDWAVRDIIRKRRQSTAAIIISFTIPFSEALNNAVENAYRQGVTTVVPAGDQATDSSSMSPASAQGAITVAASNSARRPAPFSNYGQAVDLFAPGVNVRSTFIGRPTATATRSGTVFAAAHVAGLVLYFKRLAHLPDARVTKGHVVGFATPGLIRSPGRTPNLFAYNGCGR